MKYEAIEVPVPFSINLLEKQSEGFVDEAEATDRLWIRLSRLSYLHEMTHKRCA